MATTSTASTLSATVAAHNALQQADKAMLNARRERAEHERNARQLRFEHAPALDVRRAEVRALLAQGRVTKLEADARASRRAYRALLDTVRVSKMQ